MYFTDSILCICSVCLAADILKPATRSIRQQHMNPPLNTPQMFCMWLLATEISALRFVSAGNQAVSLHIIIIIIIISSSSSSTLQEDHKAVYSRFLTVFDSNMFMYNKSKLIPDKLLSVSGWR